MPFLKKNLLLFLAIFPLIACQSIIPHHSQKSVQDDQQKKPVILLTGGTGYIGSHILVELLNSSYDIVVIDNLSNSYKKPLKRVEHITGKKILQFFHKDLRKIDEIRSVFKNYKFSAVIHLAAFKSVGESVEKPLKYYENNLFSTINLLKVMKETNTKNLVFSSSCTIYGSPKDLPITEDYQEKYGFKAINPYGETKAIIEKILIDVAQSSKKWNFISLRYFNPIGAHKSGLIGEDPLGIPTNLNPYILKVLSGELPQLTIFGDDYSTPDGTAIRDYIHVMDLASSHVKAVDLMLKEDVGQRSYNIGTSRGYSVMEVVQAYEKILGKKINYKIGARRPGDAAEIYANANQARKELHWETKRNLEDMVRDSLNWIQKNPRGYEKNKTSKVVRSL